MRISITIQETERYEQKMKMAIDKELYRKAYELHRQWNEAEFRDRLRNAGRLTPQEAFRQYCELVELCWKLYPQPSEQQIRQKADNFMNYYERIQKLEAWRRARGKRDYKPHHDSDSLL